MPINLSNTTESLAAALKDVQRLEALEAKKKEKDTPAEAVAKAVTVSISTDAKMQILKDTLKQLKQRQPHIQGSTTSHAICVTNTMPRWALQMCLVMLALVGVAGESIADETFAAIAFSRDTGANGYAYQYYNRPGAEARALKECGAYASDCTVASSFGNACGALALGDGNGWGSSRAESIIKAERNTIATCRSYDNKNCDIKVRVCSYD